MRGLTPVRTVRDMKKAMDMLPDDLPLVAMPEDGPSFMITGCINLTSSTPKQAWLIIEEISDDAQLGDGIVDADWESCGAGEDDDETATIHIDFTPIQETPLEDVCAPRGLIRSA